MGLVSYIPQKIRALEKSQEKTLDRAAAYMKTKIKEKIKKRSVSQPNEPPGKRSGDLYKGVKVGRRGRDVNSEYRIVGMGPPAHHAHLLEFGTVPRTVKNWKGKKGQSHTSGRVLPRPFMGPTFQEEAPAVERILSGAWI